MVFLSLVGLQVYNSILNLGIFFRFFVFCRARPGYPGGRSIEPKMRTEKRLKRDGSVRALETG